MDIVLEAEHLSKAFRGVLAVDDVSIAVKRGEIYGFLGPNGAGKTTTLHMLLGLVRADSGRARIVGVDPRVDAAGARQDVGFLPESLSFYRTLTGRQTLRFFADLKRVPRERVDEMLAFVGLEDASEKRVGEYSRGMAQRLGLAQALLGEPTVLILDEPTGGLDPLAQRQVKDLLRDRSKHGVTLLFSSHVLSEVQELAHRVGVLRKGRLIAEDTVESLRARMGLRGVLYLTLQWPRKEFIATALAIDGVQSARFDGSRLAVVCDDARRFEVAKAIHEGGGGVVGMETREPSLEDVYVELTEGAP